MGLEIERKFLVSGDSWRDAVESQRRLKQGYLTAQPDLTVRVRIDGERAQLTIKGATQGLSRLEFEYEIPLAEAEEMFAQLVTGGTIDKTRYRVRCGDHLWDLDLFHGDNAGLVVAEVELASEDETFRMPDWAGREVTQEGRYFNANLIRHPYRDW